MKNKIICSGRVLIAVIVLILYVMGYTYYEKTLVAWWQPVVAAGIMALLSIPLFGKSWRWLTGTADYWLNLLCHVYVIGGICYFVILGGNYVLADPSSEHEEKVLVVDKEHITRNLGFRSGRRYRTSSRKVHYYHLYARFDNGTEKKVPVSRNEYGRARKNAEHTFNIRKGALGFSVIVF